MFISFSKRFLKDIAFIFLRYDKNNDNLSEYGGKNTFSLIWNAIISKECCQRFLLLTETSPVDDVPELQSVIPVVEVGHILHTSLHNVLW